MALFTEEHLRPRGVTQLASKEVVKPQLLTPQPATPRGPLRRCLIITIGVCLWKSHLPSPQFDSPASSLWPRGPPSPRKPHPAIPEGVPAFTGIPPQAAMEKAVKPCPLGLWPSLGAVAARLDIRRPHPLELSREPVRK